MANSDSVRASRDGDQFHYVWASRCCLELLSPRSDLEAVSIEGTTTEDPTAPDKVEIVDVGEYFGGKSPDQARQVRYSQLKHSSDRQTLPVPFSDLETTIIKFAGMYRDHLLEVAEAELQSRVQFVFVTNRPISERLQAAFEDAADGVASPRYASEVNKLRKASGLNDGEFELFFSLFDLVGNEKGLWEQRELLVRDMRGYLPGQDADAPSRLKELVTRKALSESADNPTITKLDVLKALGCEESDLFPAPSRISAPTPLVIRDEYQRVAAEILASSSPSVVHADGGVGKTVFAASLGDYLPDHSIQILYDCFGDGLYRNSFEARHRHKQGLVQIANELASSGLCHPLVPSAHADTTDYVGAFLKRIVQASALIKSVNDEAILCITVDAADNAQLAAIEFGDKRAFPLDLLRLEFPENVRLVLLSRTHRQQILLPDVNTRSIELKAFEESETAELLKESHPDASLPDIQEFHRLTSQNPRVQATVLQKDLSLADSLRSLGPEPTKVEDTVRLLFESSLERLKTRVGDDERDQIERICTGLACLRPRIPLDVLAKVADVSEEAVRSFALDLGRPLRLDGDKIHFADEPSETWFRDRFEPSNAQLRSFIQILLPISERKTYVAAAIPQLMLSAGALSELVSLAIDSKGLPDGSAVERRDVELQRLGFAFAAAIQAERFLEACQLAMKAGALLAGENRRNRVIQENTDLAALFMGPEVVADFANRRTMNSDWMGSHYAYEAALLSGSSSSRLEARSHLRIAYDWIDHWLRLPESEKSQQDISIEDLVALTWAEVGVHGPGNAAKALVRWSPNSLGYTVGRQIVGRLLDQSRFNEAHEFVDAPESSLCIVLAGVVEFQKVLVELHPTTATRAFRLLSNSLVDLTKIEAWDDRHKTLGAITAIVETVTAQNLVGRPEAVRLLKKYLPSTPPSSLKDEFSRLRRPAVRAYCLLTSLEEREPDLNELAHPDIRDELENLEYSRRTHDVREFSQAIGGLVPWYKLLTDSRLGLVPEASLADRIGAAQEASNRALRDVYGDRVWIGNDVLLCWMEVLARNRVQSDDLLRQFREWVLGLSRVINFDDAADALRLCRTNPQFHGLAIEFATFAYGMVEATSDEAEEANNYLVALARAILTISDTEAQVFFNHAMELDSKLGTEAVDQWVAVLSMAECTASDGSSDPELVFNMGRCAELVRGYVYKEKHFPRFDTVRALARLSPSSALAITSRWRDRKAGTRSTFATLVGCLVEYGFLDGMDALPLISFRDDWNYAELLNAALESAGDQSKRVTAARHAKEYLRFLPGERAGFEEVCLRLRMDNFELFRAEDWEPEALTSSHVFPKADPGIDEDQDQDQCVDWADVFSERDPSAHDGLSEALEFYLSGNTPWRRNEFYSAAIQRIAPGREINFIKAVGVLSDFDLYDMAELWESIPEQWFTRPGTRISLGELLKSKCAEYCNSFVRYRRYASFPKDKHFAQVGLSRTDIHDWVIRAMTDRDPDLFSAEYMFAAAGFLADKLSHSEAETALRFSLNLYESVLAPESGDGPWRKELEPPTEVSASLASYIWACLASPEGALRWEAAHAVYGYIVLDRKDLIKSLFNIAKNSSAGAFVDESLHFYRLHALQWFLIAVSRGAQQNPTALTDYTSEVLKWALGDSDHVLIKGFAGQAILSMNTAGCLKLDPGLVEQIDSVNRPLVSDAQRGSQPDGDELESLIEASTEEDRYSFALDIGPYWYEPLAQVFGLNQSDVENLALKVIRTDLGFEKTSRWDEDERRRRDIYDRRASLHSHGSYPREDDLHFYNSYHAMLISAGRLLKALPIHQSEHSDESGCEFENWLSGHWLVREDGRWLSDLRDTSPVPLPKWLGREAVEVELPEIAEEDFEEAMGSQNSLIVWGQWDAADNQIRRSVYVSSALVSPSRSESLLRALSSTTDPYAYGIPTYQDNLEINSGEFVLRGWIRSSDRSHGLDDQDPWSGGIRFPPYQPAPFVVQKMNVQPDSDSRFWSDQNGHAVFSSRQWGKFDDEYGSDTADSNSGSRLEVSKSKMAELLRSLDMDLIVKVYIDQRRRYESYQDRMAEKEGERQRNDRLFLFKPD